MKCHIYSAEENNCQFRIMYPVKISFKRDILDNLKLKELITSIPKLKLLKEALHPEEKLS